MKTWTLFKARGIGLIETLIALLIISGGTIALINFQQNLVYSNNLAQQRAEATVLAVNKIESLRAFGVLNTTSGYSAYQDIVSRSSTATGQNAAYALTWTVTTSSTTPTYKIVDVTVSWTDRRNVNQSIQLSTQILGADPATQANIV